MIIIFQLKVAILGYTPFSDITGGILCIVGIGRLIFGRLNWGFNIQNPTWKLDYRLDHPFSLDLSSIFCGKNQGNTLTIHQIRDIYIYTVYMPWGIYPIFLFSARSPEGFIQQLRRESNMAMGISAFKKFMETKMGMCIHIQSYIYIYIHTVYIYMYVYTHIYLVGDLEHFLFSHILGIVTPTDFHIFQRGWNHQPEYVHDIFQNITIILVF